MSDSNPVGQERATQSGVATLDDLFHAVNRSDTPGLVVGVAHHGKHVYRRGFGLASVELGVANTPWTRMRIGSTSKHFTCLAILLLAEEGKLDIDASVRAYMPELPPLKAEPTLRQLMTHTGGHRCYLDLGFVASGMAIRPKGVALRMQVRQTEANFAPGEKMIYNNGGYHLLSLLIERISGIPFEQFLKDRIFTPLSMADTASVRSDFEIHRGTAALHVALPDGGWRRGMFPSEEVLGEGAIVSTVDDMLRWLAHLRGQKIVGSESSWRHMLTPAKLTSGLVTPYALGLFRHRHRGVEIIHHNGGVIGGTCQMLTVPSHELDIIIMANGAKVDVLDLGYKVVDTVLGDAALAPAEIKAASERFKPMLGARYYARSSGNVIGFSDIEGKLGLSVFNYMPTPLHDDGATLRLGVEDVAAGPFVIDTAELAEEGTPPASLNVAEGGRAEPFERLPETAPSAAEVGPAMAGCYQSPDLGADAHIEFDGEQLKLRIFGQYGINDATLIPLSADVYSLQLDDSLFPLKFLLSIEHSEDRVTGFRINTLRTRHLRFERLPY